MLKKLLILALLAGLVFADWKFGYQAALRYFFRASGTVSVRPDLLNSLPGPNAMLFVVARNSGGVPVAVKKIINPVFPARFEMGPSNLIMPDLLTRRLYLEAALNTHGRLGDVRRGDIKGQLNSGVSIISKGSSITLDVLEK